MSSQYDPQAPRYAGMTAAAAQPQAFSQQMPHAAYMPQPGALPSGAIHSGAGMAAPAAPYPAALGMMQAPAAYHTPTSQQTQTAQPFFNFANDRFLRGLLIGAAATYLLTNEEVQRTVIKGAVKVWTTVQGGLEEAKERFRDAEAELQAAATDRDD